MRWSRRSRFALPLAAGALLLAGASLRIPAPQAGAQEPPGQISIYSREVGFSIPVVQRGAAQYVGLVEALEPFGSVSARVDGRRWRLRFGRSEAVFTQGSTGAQVRGSTVVLAAEFLIEGERGMVPLESLAALLSPLINMRVEHHVAAGRLVAGDAAIRFQAELQPPPAQGVVLTFSRPVNPFIATEPGRLRMVFRHDPVVSAGVRDLTFDSALVPAAGWREGNGTAELVFTGTAPLLATFGDGGRTITISAAPAPPLETPPAVEPPPAAPAFEPATPAPSPAPRPRFVVLVDAAHGGEESGAVLAEGLLEKDVTLMLARRLRHELGNRGLHAALLRDGDLTLTLAQRAELANRERPGLYVSLHAAAPGSGVRVYTALIPAAEKEAASPLPRWEWAQAAHLEASHTVAQTVAAELGARNLPVAVLSAPLRPLRSVAAPAIVLEIAAGPAEAEGLRSPQHQAALAAALAEAISAARQRLPQTPAGRAP